MCVALAVLEATVRVTGPRGERVIALSDFHRLPGDTPQRDTNLEGDELITSVELPARGFAANYTYLKIRDRLSYAFALVSVAVGLELEGGTIKQARFALGGVAHKPWRDPAAEAALRGQAADPATFKRIARRGLKPLNKKNPTERTLRNAIVGDRELRGFEPRVEPRKNQLFGLWLTQHRAMSFMTLINDRMGVVP